ncbi:MAG: hypothetical protein Kow0042_27760 [Calditrichia bacterium]
MGLGNLIVNKIKEERSKVTDARQKEKFNIVQVREGDCQIQVKVKDIDTYGIVLDYIAISRDTPILDVDLINKKLEEQSEMVEERITYLLEDFRLIELDRINKRAQLRSYPPHEKEDAKFYYEIVLDEGVRAHFQRYVYSIEKKRYEKITSQLTIETFERLVDDLAKSLCEKT